MSKDQIKLTNGLALKFSEQRIPSAGSYGKETYVLRLLDGGRIIATGCNPVDWLYPVAWAGRALIELDNINQQAQLDAKNKLDVAIDAYHSEKKRLEAEAKRLAELMKEVREVEEKGPDEEVPQP